MKIEVSAVVTNDFMPDVFFTKELESGIVYRGVMALRLQDAFERGRQERIVHDEVFIRGDVFESDLSMWTLGKWLRLQISLRGGVVDEGVTLWVEDANEIARG